MTISVFRLRDFRFMFQGMITTTLVTVKVAFATSPSVLTIRLQFGMAQNGTILWAICSVA